MKITKKINENEEFIYAESFWSGKKEVTLNGTKLEKIDKRQFKNGDEIFVVKGNFLTGVSLVSATRTIDISVNEWYDWLLIFLPFINVVGGVFGGMIGGFLSALFSFISAFVNTIILRSELKMPIKIILCIVSILVASGLWFGIYYGIAYAILTA